MKDNFERKLQEDFTSNTPDVLNKIKQSNRFKVPNKPEKQSISDIFKLRKVRFTFASLFVVVLLAVVLINRPTEQIYASTVTIDINPRLEIQLDEDDKVIDIQALNDDGEEIIQELGNYKRQQLQVVLANLVRRLYEDGYLDETENVLMVYVEGVSEQVQQRVQENVQTRMNQEAVKYQRTLTFIQRNNLDYTSEQMEEINEFSRNNNIHPGRVIIILEILDADTEDTYTVEDLNQLSLRELYNVYLTFYPETNGNQNNSGNNN